MEEQSRAELERSKKRQKYRHWKNILGLLVLILGIVLVTFGIDVYKNIQSTTEEMHQETGGTTGHLDMLKAGEPISILLLGIDNGFQGRATSDGRSDVMMVLTINPEDKESVLLSIPRDTLVEIDGEKGRFDKINHAYMYGGVASASDTVSHYLDVPIHFYVSVNMQGLIDVIDAIGGIEVTSRLTFDYQGHQFVQGERRTFSGKDALAYSRMRKEDPEAGAGREKRQQQVIQAIIMKIASFSTLTKYEDILETLEDNVTTDIDLTEGRYLYQNYMVALKNLDRVMFDDYQDMWLAEGYYLGVPELERYDMANLLRENLGLGLTTTDFSYLNQITSLTDDPDNLINGMVNESNLSDEQPWTEENQEPSGSYGPSVQPNPE